MASDPYKAMTLRYNHLNLPTLFDFGAGKTIEVYYDRAGAKLRKTVKTNATTTQYVQDYVGGLEYRTTGTGALTLEAIYHAEGRITPVGANWQYEYSIRDHLGNTRLTFADLNANGVVDVTGNNTTTEILNEYHYYPFGMNMAYDWTNNVAIDNKYQYNGIERNNDFDLNIDFTFFRGYDSSTGRWLQVDPKPNIQHSLYASRGNNPLIITDVLGDTLRGVNDRSAQRLQSIIRGSFGDSKAGKATAGLFKIKGNTFEHISRRDFNRATRGLSSDQRKLAIGYYRTVNEKSTHIVDVVKKGESLDSYTTKHGSLEKYKNDVGGLDSENSGGYTHLGNTSEKPGLSNGADNSSLSVVVMDSRHGSAGEILAHELIGHAYSMTQGMSEHSGEAVQATNIYRRANNIMPMRMDHGVGNMNGRSPTGVPYYMNEVLFSTEINN
jgi:RHS repeat-associated protein